MNTSASLPPRRTPNEKYNQALSLLVLHCTRAMPDSMPERKRLLIAIETILPEDHPATPNIRNQLKAIDALETLQEELPLKFQ